MKGRRGGRCVGEQFGPGAVGEALVCYDFAVLTSLNLFNGNHQRLSFVVAFDAK